MWKGRLLFVVGVRRQIRGGLQRDSTRWIARQFRGVTADILRGEPRKKKKKEERSGINFTTTARKFKVWNIRIDDSQRTEDDIHIGLQRCSKGVSDSQLQHQNDYIFIYVLLFLPVLSPSSRRVRRILPRPADVRKTSTFFFFRRVKQCLNMTRSYCTTLSRRCVIPGDAPFL